MSLQVESTHRGRSRSPSGRERDRSSSRMERSPSGRSSANVVSVPYPSDSDPRRGSASRILDYDDYHTTVTTTTTTNSSRPADDPKYRHAADVDVKYGDGRREKDYLYERKKREDDKFAHLPAKYAKKAGSSTGLLAADSGSHRDRSRSRSRTRHSDRTTEHRTVEKWERDHAIVRDGDKDLVYGSGPVSSAVGASSSTYSYSQPKQWEYAHPEPYKYANVAPRESTTSVREDTRYYRDTSYSHDPRASSASVLTVDSAHQKRHRSRSRSPMPTKEMSRLSVNNLGVSNARNGGSNVALAAGGAGLAAGAASPLLESYHGTYQSMSPMPSPLMLPSHGASNTDVQIMDINGPNYDDDLPTSAGGSGGGDKIRRRARFYDPEADAERIATALRGDRHPPDVEPLIEILPGLTHEQVMELRVEYKHIVKTGPERRGVNVAKHIRARLKDEDPALMKACYATALGRWESEAYWANFWYHGDKTRRELLIESLMGRTNDEIRLIKDNFSDKKYGDSLTRCMRTELKEDKFKRAVLFVLDEQRMEEFDRDGRRLPIDSILVEEDVLALYHAVHAEKGGETAMINVVVQRSDSHLRAVLRLYSAQYKSNFARDCLKKSGNLVGEMLAHILNGVINKPVRDALLVHHALTASKRDDLRRELVISRLVRFHWDRHHMNAIKAAYRTRYNKDMQEAVRESTGNSGWGLFCRELCITRHPDEVKRVERVDIHREERRG